MFAKSQVQIAVLVAVGAAAAPAVAQDQQPTQRVEITGSAIKRIDAERAVPVSIVTREDIQQLGVTTTDQLLATVTSTSFVGANTAAEGAGLSTYGLTSVSLRGLGANHTLVLVNGRRLANYATDGTTVDINSIPLSAVDRVEILRDGASSLYGTDAMAGVVNFILRSNYNGLEASAYAGTPTRSGGGQIYKAGLVGGFGDLNRDRYNVLLSFDVSKEKALYGRDRAFAANSWDNAGLFDNSATPSGALRGPWNPALGNLAGQQVLSGLGNPLSPGNCAQNGSAFDPNFGTCRFNASPYVPLVPDAKRYNLAANATFMLNNDVQLFAEAFFTRNETTTIEQPSPVSAAFLTTDLAFVGTGVPQSLLLFPGNPNYPTAYLAGTASAGQPVSVSYRAFDAGNRNHIDVANQYHLAAGVKGSYNTLDYELVASANSSKVSEATQGGYFSQLAMVKLLNSIPTWNPYVQYQTPAIAAQILGTNYNGPMLDSTLTVNGLDGKISKDLIALPGGQLTGAAGVSFHREHMNFQPSPVFMTGDISGYGGQQLPIDRGRNVSAVFAEVEAPIIKSLSVDLGVRTDRYPAQTTTNPKLSLRFQPVKEVLIRGSAGTGFRAPSLPELYNPNTLGTTGNFVDPVTKVRGQFNETLGGNPNLRPEKSEQHGIGIVFQPTAEFSVGLDWFHVRIKDFITSLPAQFIVQQAAAGNPAYVGLVTRDAGNNISNIMATNLNAGSSTVEGVDVDLKWRAAHTAWGNVDLALKGTYASKYNVTLPDGTVQQCIGATVDAAGNLLNCGPNQLGIIFRWRHVATVGISNSTWGGSLTQNYQTGYGDNTDTNNNPHSVGAFATYDAEVHYSGIKNLRLALGVKNLLNRNPPVAITSGSYFQVGYDPTYYDARARFLYLAANYKFW